MAHGSVTIDARFCGPPGAGNGGYTAGLLAGRARGPIEVRFRRPLPLGVPLELADGDEGGWVLRREAATLVEAAPAAFELAVPSAPAFGEAEEAATRFRGAVDHPAPDCFVCGPARRPDDGLALRTGPLGKTDGRHAAPWVPHASLADGGRVRAEFLAAALDCPGYYAVSPDLRLRVLALLSLEITGEVGAGERCVVAAWPLEGAGRRRQAATALYDGRGTCVARAIGTWVELPRR